MFAQSHPVVKSLHNKMSPYYDDLSYVFEKDQATGARLETFADVRSNVPGRFNDFSVDDAHDPKILTMYNQGLDMPPDELIGTRLG